MVMADNELIGKNSENISGMLYGQRSAKYEFYSFTVCSNQMNQTIQNKYSSQNIYNQNYQKARASHHAEIRSFIKTINLQRLIVTIAVDSARPTIIQGTHLDRDIRSYSLKLRQI